MFKKILLGLTIVVTIFIGFIAFQLSSNSVESPPAKARFQQKNLEIIIDYHRPFKKGRNIFGGLVPFGKYWRTGANNATEIEFNKDLSFGGQKIVAGRYRLYTIPKESTWKFVLNSELDKWGLFEPNYELNVLMLDVNAANNFEVREQFEISFDESGQGASLILSWDQTKVEVPLSWKLP